MVPRVCAVRAAPVIRPSVRELLEGVATGLDDTVVPALPLATQARNQARAASVILRRVAAVWDRVVPTLEADNRDLAETLGQLLEEGGDAFASEFARRIADTRCTPEGGAEPLPFDAAAARNEALQGLLVETQGSVAGWVEGEVKDRARATLAGLSRRMLAREQTLARR
jgi:hypothetical protein